MVPSFIPPSVAAKAGSPQPASKSKLSAMTLAFVAALVVASAGLGFAGGRLTAPAATGRGNFGPGANPGNFGPGASGAPGQNRGGFGGFGGAETALIGTVTAIANGTITVQTSAGQSITVQVPSTVTYHTATAATATAVGVGTSVELTMTRPNGRPDGSGNPGASPAAGGPGGFSLTATDILILAK
jgi:hypothetical protein